MSESCYRHTMTIAADHVAYVISQNVSGVSSINVNGVSSIEEGAHGRKIIFDRVVGSTKGRRKDHNVLNMRGAS